MIAIKSRGRPKGRVYTAIGFKPKVNINEICNVEPIRKVRKIRETSVNVDKEKVTLPSQIPVKPPKSKQFVDMTVNEKAFVILSHCLIETKVYELVTKNVKIEDKDFIIDQKNKGWFRDDRIEVEILQSFLPSNDYSKLKKLLSKRSSKWFCHKCNCLLNGKQLSCDRCVEWQHLKCTILTELPDDETVWFCDKCTLT